MNSTHFCGHCGAPIGPGMTFCGRCGTPFAPLTAAGAAATTAAPSPVAPPAPVAPGAGPVTCPRCGAVNAPTARFCARCAQPLLGGPPAMPATAAGMAAPLYPLATPPQIATALPRKRRGTPWALIGAGGAIVMIVLAVVARGLTPVPTPGCGAHCTPPPPPLQPPLPPQHQYTSTTYGYTLAYQYTPSTTDGQSIGWSGTLNDGTPFLCKFQAEPANGRAPQQIVESVQQSLYSGANTVYTIPGAEIGYTLGYGNIYDVTVAPAGGQNQEYHVAIEAAVQDNLAIELIVATPYAPDKAEHPNPAQLNGFMEFFADGIGNTVTWKGEKAF